MNPLNDTAINPDSLSIFLNFLGGGGGGRANIHIKWLIQTSCQYCPVSRACEVVARAFSLGSPELPSLITYGTTS